MLWLGVAYLAALHADLRDLTPDERRLSCAAALLHDPPVLLLDEPTAALDPASRDALFADLTRLRDDGHAVLLTTHHVDEAEGGCDGFFIARLKRAG